MTTLFHRDSDAGALEVFVHERGLTCYYSSNVVSYVVDRCIVITLSLVKGNLQDDAG